MKSPQYSTVAVRVACPGLSDLSPMATRKGWNHDNCWEGFALRSYGLFIETHLLDVLRDGRLNEPSQGLSRTRRLADCRCRCRLMQVFQQMNANPRQDQVSDRDLLVKWLGHFRSWPQTFRQGIRHIRQRVARPSRHDEGALTKQRFRLMPIRNLRKGIHPNQQIQPVAVLE